MSYHVPVLCEATLDGLVHDPDGLYADCTLGGGGHSERLLARISAEFPDNPLFRKELQRVSQLRGSAGLASRASGAAR